ncbi:MAG: hypothetical protein U1C12_02265, partial [Patescibacteria group bacterium]|nr:hypothetical protein [Patescibacteria group bacterium]
MNQIVTKTVPREVCLEILKKRVDALGLSIEYEWKKKNGARCVCFEVSGPRAGHSNKWFCFAVILTVPELKLGIWTRKSMEYHKDTFDVVEADRAFEPTSFD